MSCLEMPRSPVPDFLGEQRRAFNDAETMQPRAPAAVPAEARNGARVKTQDVRPQGVYLPNYNVLTPQHALARVRADVDGGGDHARRHERLHAPLQLHALPEPAAHLSRRLPRQLRLLRPGAPSRGRAQLRRPQLHPRRLAGGAATTRSIDIVAARRRRRPLPPHVHLHDHAPALRRRHARRC